MSLAANILFYIGCSLSRTPSAIERVQADLFVPPTLAPRAPSFRLRRASVTVEELTAKGAEFSEPISTARFGRLTRLRIPGGGEIGLYQPSHATAYDLEP